MKTLLLVWLMMFSTALFAQGEQGDEIIQLVQGTMTTKPKGDFIGYVTLQKFEGKPPIITGLVMVDAPAKGAGRTSMGGGEVRLLLTVRGEDKNFKLTVTPSSENEKKYFLDQIPYSSQGEVSFQRDSLFSSHTLVISNNRGDDGARYTSALFFLRLN